MLGIVTRLWAGRSWVRILVLTKNLSFPQYFLTDSGVHLASFYSMDTGFFAGGWGGELNHSPLSSANAKNEWCNKSSPSIYIHGEYR